MSAMDSLTEIHPLDGKHEQFDPAQVELDREFNRWLRWLRLRRASTWMVHGLAAGLGAGLAFAWLLVWRGDLLRPEYILLIIAACLAGFLLGAVIAFAWPVSRAKAARTLDRQLGLQERLSTALELAANLEKDPPSSPEGAELRREQLFDALDAVQKVDLRSRLPIRIPRRSAALVLLLGIAAIAGPPLAVSRFQAAAQSRSVQSAIEAEAARIEALSSEVRNDPQLNASQKETLARPLQAAVQTLQETPTLEESVSALAQAQGELQALADPQAAKLSEELRQAGQSLAESAGSPLAQTGQQLATREFGKAAQTLAGVDHTRLSQAQQQALARQLEGLSDALKETAPSLSQQLGEASRQQEAGQSQAAQRALQQAAESLAATGEELAQSSAAEQAAAQVDASRQRLLQSAGAPASPGAGNGSQAGGKGSGQAAGTGGSQPGQASSSGGSGRGEGQSETGSGVEAGVSPIQPANGPGDGGLQPAEQVYAPQRFGGEGGPIVTLPEDGQPGETQSGSSVVPVDQTGQSQVPYVQVYPAYAEAYRQAIERGEVPPALRDVVREYFSSLEP